MSSITSATRPASDAMAKRNMCSYATPHAGRNARRGCNFSCSEVSAERRPDLALGADPLADRGGELGGPGGATEIEGLHARGDRLERRLVDRARGALGGGAVSLGGAVQHRAAGEDHRKRVG